MQQYDRLQTRNSVTNITKAFVIQATVNYKILAASNENVSRFQLIRYKTPRYTGGYFAIYRTALHKIETYLTRNRL